MNEEYYSTIESSINPLNQNIRIPPPHLREIVRYIWYFCPKQMKRSSDSYRIVADGYPGLVFHHTQGRSTISDTGGGLLPMAFVHGQDLIPCINQEHGNSFVLGVKFFPSALRRIFKIDAHEATNKLIPLNDLAGYNILDQLINAKTSAQLLDIVINYLTQKLILANAEDKIINDALQNISKDFLLSPSALARKYAISQRQFQRRFKTQVGVSPETYVRVMKFQKSLFLIKTNQYNKLSDIAYNLGYADQAHFIREFKTFSGITPKTVEDHLPVVKNAMAVTKQQSPFCTFRILS